MRFHKLNRQHLLRITQSVAFIGFLSIFFLSIGIENLRFDPGTPLPSGTGTLPILSIGMGLHGNWLLNMFLVLLLGMFPLAVILLIFSAEARRIFKKYLKALFVWFVFLLSFRLYVLLSKGESISETNSGNQPSIPAVLNPPSIPTNDAVANPEIYSPPNLPAWLGYLIGFLIALILSLLIYYFWIRNQPDDEKLKKIVLNAITDINQSHQWEDAIIQCYARMNKVVSNRKQMDRQSFSTPAEFASELTAAGLPSGPVNTLTILFERARYGRGSTRTTDAEEAIDCLTAITHSLDVVS